mmetsp:Transcript_41051/g.103088  ORF Transcript_41051/g.103088 Transcript_41051/m.103088 type:complete len:316 (+) Transcript_41051:245-1192(+)
MARSSSSTAALSFQSCSMASLMASLSSCTICTCKWSSSVLASNSLPSSISCKFAPLRSSASACITPIWASSVPARVLNFCSWACRMSICSSGDCPMSSCSCSRRCLSRCSSPSNLRLADSHSARAAWSSCCLCVSVSTSTSSRCSCSLASSSWSESMERIISGGMLSGLAMLCPRRSACRCNSKSSGSFSAASGDARVISHSTDTCLTSALHSSSCRSASASASSCFLLACFASSSCRSRSAICSCSPCSSPPWPCPPASLSACTCSFDAAMHRPMALNVAGSCRGFVTPSGCGGSAAAAGHRHGEEASDSAVPR